jgi:hypothetical protein
MTDAFDLNREQDVRTRAAAGSDWSQAEWEGNVQQKIERKRCQRSDAISEGGGSNGQAKDCETVMLFKEKVSERMRAKQVTK